jgi:hypothetical protein
MIDQCGCWKARADEPGFSEAIHNLVEIGLKAKKFVGVFEG